jgi:hypothetical protein
MILLICLYAGITGVTALVAIAGANAGMILFGWLQEAMNPPGPYAHDDAALLVRLRRRAPRRGWR